MIPKNVRHYFQANKSKLPEEGAVASKVKSKGNMDNDRKLMFFVNCISRLDNIIRIFKGFFFVNKFWIL
jgi:hypothetical protein